MKNKLYIYINNLYRQVYIDLKNTIFMDDILMNMMIGKNTEFLNSVFGNDNKYVGIGKEWRVAEQIVQVATVVNESLWGTEKFFFVKINHTDHWKDKDGEPYQHDFVIVAEQGEHAFTQLSSYFDIKYDDIITGELEIPNNLKISVRKVDRGKYFENQFVSYISIFEE